MRNAETAHDTGAVTAHGEPTAAAEPRGHRVFLALILVAEVAWLSILAYVILRLVLSA